MRVPALLFFALLSACGFDGTVPAEIRKDKDLREFLNIAAESSSEPALRYTALEPVIARARSAGELDWLASLLGGIIEANPRDPYGAYYLMAMAEGARDSGSDDLALDYLRRLLNGFPDLEISGRSLHLLAMGEIAVKSDDPREVIAMRMDMQSRFPNRIDEGRNQYYLAEVYETIGEWESMYASYRAFASSLSVIPGVPDARHRIRSALRFHASDKSWTMESLDDIVGTVKYAIKNLDAPLLRRYQADNFFLMNWSQDSSDDFTRIPMNLGSFLKSSVRYRNELESFSNDREAYLWTAGWTWRIPTWYLYFRRIDYPANPEINGRWEWAGVYFGERL